MARRIEQRLVQIVDFVALGAIAHAELKPEIHSKTDEENGEGDRYQVESANEGKGDDRRFAGGERGEIEHGPDFDETPGLGGGGRMAFQHCAPRKARRFSGEYIFDYAGSRVQSSAKCVEGEAIHPRAGQGIIESRG